MTQTLDRLDPQERALIEQIHDMVNAANTLPPKWLRWLTFSA